MFAIIGIEILKFIKISLLAKNIKEWYEKLDKVKIILLLSTLFLAIKHVKLLPFFVITGTIFGYEDLFKLLKDVKLPNIKEGLIYAVIIIMCTVPLFVKQFSIPLNTVDYPVKEVEFIKINDIKGNILVNFGLGSYVSYKLYPCNRIFMDGRYEEVYYDYMVPLLKKFYLVNPYWNEILEKFPPDVMIIENYYPVYGVLSESKDWAKIYDGKSFGVFVPKNNVKQEYKLPTDDNKYYKENLFKTDIKF